MTDLQPVVSALIIVALELAVVALLCGLSYKVVRLVSLRLAAQPSARLSAWSCVVQAKTRNLLLAASAASTSAIFLYNAWLLARGVDARRDMLDLLRSVTLEAWRGAATVAWKLALAGFAVWAVTRVARRLLRVIEQTINRWDQLKDNNRSLAALFSGFDRAIVNSGGLVLVAFACHLTGVPGQVLDAALLGLRIYVVFAIGLAAVRSTSVAIDTLDGLSARYASQHEWSRFYDQLRPLLPTLRLCLEYALWIGLVSAIVAQIAPIRDFATWGPRLMQAIGILFATRVLIELGRLELARRILPDEGLQDADRRRRATVVPLVQTAFSYALYFGAGVLMLSSLNFNPMPFLAGAGILGLVVGFGAQPLINDVVSGFFILFENTYLVGETIEVGGARGVVEAIDFRTTKIRDGEGRLHIMRNGDMKPIVNFSRDYTVAVVDLTVGYDADLRDLFTAIREAAERLHAEEPDVLAATVIEGVVAFGPSTLTVRTQTRVNPGRCGPVAAALRFAIKEVFDRRSGGTFRRTLIPKTTGQPSRFIATRES